MKPRLRKSRMTRRGRFVGHNQDAFAHRTRNSRTARKLRSFAVKGPLTAANGNVLRSVLGSEAITLAIALILMLALGGKAKAQMAIANRGTENPTLLYRGEPLFRVGPLPEVAVFAMEWGSPDFPHQQWLDWMEQHQLGYGRVYPESGCSLDTTLAVDGVRRRVFPFITVHDKIRGTAIDLTKFDPAYWENFARVIEECASRSIILQMQLYQRCFFERRRWDTNYFHPSRNVNKLSVPPGAGGYGLWKAMTNEAPWRALHREWVEHILKGIGNNGNVIIDLMNEGAFKNGLTKQWIEQTLDIIERWEQETGNDLLVGMDFDHFYKKADPGLEYVLSHPRMELIICEGSEAHVVSDLVAGDRRKQKESLAIKYRKQYHKPIVSTNSPGYSVDENPEVMRLYQWYSLMVKLQGVGVYAKKYPLDFSNPSVEQYARQSKTLVQFFESLDDYIALDLASQKIVSAPGRYRLALASLKETVVYLHTDGFGNEIEAGQLLVLKDLDMAEDTVLITFLHPDSGRTVRTMGAIKKGQLTIPLPRSFEDIAIHILPD